MIRRSSLLALIPLLLIGGHVGWAESAGPRLEPGQFSAVKFAVSPTIDGVQSEGEWDGAMTTSGLVTPFSEQMQESATTMSLGFDDERIYFLFRAKREAGEWRLLKRSRQNDDYDFGEPTVEVWVTPPSDVAETFQNIINTYPAVYDQHHIPSRGYAAQGWKANWNVAVTETPDEYVVEASVPIKDLGFSQIKDGDVWRFLLARNVPGAKPRPQASWSLTSGFAEIPQHPAVLMQEDGPVVQLEGVPTILSGEYAIDLTLLAGRKSGTEAEIEFRLQQGAEPGEKDRVEKRQVKLKAGDQETLAFAGQLESGETGVFVVRATKPDGTLIFRQSFPFKVSGWKPSTPQRPADAPEIEPVTMTAQYGPETSTVLVRVDVLDFPSREQVASATATVFDAAGREMASGPLRPFVNSYSGAAIEVPKELVPVEDFSKVEDLQKENFAIRQRNRDLEAAKKRNKAEPGAKPEKLLEIPQTPPKEVRVVVSLKDQNGRELHQAEAKVNLLRYEAPWMNNSVGLTDKVIPPYTPVTVEGSEVGVWNRTYTLNSLGLASKIINHGTEQLAAPMKLIAVQNGQNITVPDGKAKLTRSVQNQADFTGQTEAAGLQFETKTQVEFDGFVLNRMRISPAGDKAEKVDRLFLEIELPENLASHFCSTSGGWAAVHDELPERWTSQSTASGMLVGDFVPYILLTNSEKAFLWFADSDQGWNHDADKLLPTQEIIRRDGKTILRVNFFEVPTTVDEPREIVWGWQTFPARPLPAGWRATFCTPNPPIPKTTYSYFWNDADWAVVWPYFCSPFAWNFERSKEILARASKDPRQRPMPGSIAHSIGRYQDYEWNKFPGLAVDWGRTPGETSNARVTASKGPNDFRLWHYQRWVKEGGLRGLYVDENYLALEDNFLTGNAYWRPDGQLQRAYNYLGLREYFKRLKVVFHENGVPEPNLWQHISSGAAYHAWPGDIFFEGENVEPTNLEFDYLAVLPAGRLRAIGSSVVSGGIMTMMLQSQRHKTEWSDKHNHQFTGWVMAHDILPEQCKLYPHLVNAAHLWEREITFLPYWKPSPFTSKQEGVLVSAHQGPERTILWVVNTTRQPEKVSVEIDWKTFGHKAAECTLFNAETGAPLAHDQSGFTVEVPERDFVPVLIAPQGTESPGPRPTK